MLELKMYRIAVHLIENGVLISTMDVEDAVKMFDWKNEDVYSIDVDFRRKLEINDAKILVGRHGPLGIIHRIDILKADIQNTRIKDLNNPTYYSDCWFLMEALGILKENIIKITVPVIFPYIFTAFGKITEGTFDPERFLQELFSLSNARTRVEPQYIQNYGQMLVEGYSEMDFEPINPEDDEEDIEKNIYFQCLRSLRDYFTIREIEESVKVLTNLLSSLDDKQKNYCDLVLTTLDGILGCCQYVATKKDMDDRQMTLQEIM